MQYRNEWDSFKTSSQINYLGSLITSDDRCINEIKWRMAQAKVSFQNMKSILTNKRMPLEVRVHRSNGNVVLEKNAQSIMDRKGNQFRNYKYSKPYKKAYEQHQEKTSRISSPCDEKGKLEHLLTTGKIEGKRSRGRQRIKIQDGIAAWLGRSTADMFVDARDRKKWKVMIAYACNRHGN